WDGSGTATSPYLIADATDLAKLATDVNSGNDYANTYFKLTSDIDLTAYNQDNNSWTPIGNDMTPFRGNLDGNSFVIKNLNINMPSTTCVGLFGLIEISIIKNLGIASGIINGDITVGSIAGINFLGTIENCYNTCTINGFTSLGGIAGANYLGTIENCHNTGSLNGTAALGGIAGINAGAIKNCYSLGTINGFKSIGGIVGFNYTTIENSYNSGAISGDSIVGGIAGFNGDRVENCFNCGNISGNENIGGVVGVNDESIESLIYGTDTISIVRNCYNSGAISGKEALGGIVGGNYVASLTENCYNAGSVDGNSEVGGVAGVNYRGTVTNCYYNSEAFSGAGIGIGTVGTVQGKTTAEMTTTGFAASLGSAFEKRAADADYCYYPELKVFKTDGNSAAQTASQISTAVARRTPIITSIPSTTAITYGQAINSSALSGGSAIDPATGTAITGSFSWNNPSSTFPTVANSNSADFALTFTSGLDLYKPASGTAKITVNKANLTAVADNQFKTYGENNPSLSISYNGLVNNDSAASFSSPPTISTSANSNSDVGTYPVTISGGTFDNYNVTYIPGILTVSKATITVTPDDKSKTYYDDNPSLSFQYSGFVNGENENVLSSKPSASTTADKLSDAGTYPITLSGGSSDNYTFNYVSGVLTVNKATLTITADDKVKTVGKDNPSLSFQYSGFLNGEDESVLSSKPSASTDADKDSPVGSYSITISGGSADNYTFDYVSGTLTVKKAFPILWLIIGVIAIVVIAGAGAFILLRKRRGKTTG
ncbi:MAG: hypothetical protein FWF98_04160, partial [Dehalococcoidia bacterium]|nr:hypothetical protein [Dehalococcoidia bacterium]